MTRLSRRVAGAELSYQYTVGRGPVIVFVSGLGDSGSVWEAILGCLPEGLSTFTFDRAGCGHSGALDEDLAATPRPAGWAAKQLRDLLITAGVPMPWVLVGHSVGGLVVDAFARRWPEEVVGLVLVDASDPALHTRLDHPKPVLLDGDHSTGWSVSLPQTLVELGAEPPRGVETVVIRSAVGRWLRVVDTAPYLPLTMAEVDQHWHLHQLQLAQRWHGQLVVPHLAGHRVHEDEPALVAHIVQTVAADAAASRTVCLDAAEILALHATVRAFVGADQIADEQAPDPQEEAADFAVIEAIRARGERWIDHEEAQQMMDEMFAEDFERRTREALQELNVADLADYQKEARELAEVDVEVTERD